jgi:hypothetical protein
MQSNLEDSPPARPSLNRSLQECVSQVLSPGALRADVDALLRALEHPLAQSDSPRSRADSLISLLESNRVSGMKGSSGQQVHAAALEALLKLGLPYALELSPAALTRARRSTKRTRRNLPVAGLLLLLAGALLMLFTMPLTAALEYVLILLILTSPTILGGWLRIPALLKAGVVFMGLVSGLALVLAVRFYEPDTSRYLMFNTLGNTFAKLLAGAGLYLCLCAALLGRPWWRVEDGSSPQETAP